jgi:ABC-2 type transport system permease protein
VSGRLARVELRRYLARAGVRWLVVGMLAAVLLTAFAAWRSSKPPSEAMLAQAQQQVVMAQADWAQNGAQYLADCQANQLQARQTDPYADFHCDGMEPTVEKFLPPQQTFAENAADWLGQASTFVLLLALILGATFVAAEFSTGAISTWLTFEPRRGRVFASKAVVATVVTGVAALLVSVLAVAAFWGATAVNHAVGQVTARTLIDLGNQSGRIAAAVAGAALVGAVLGFLLRHTAAVIAVVIGWFVAVDGILVSSLLRAPRWAVATNLEAWLRAGTRYYQQTPCVPDPLGHGYACGTIEKSLSMTSGALTLVALLVVVTALALVVFRRRDVA